MRVLADDVRAFLIESCSVTGGHIGAGLGVVELTIALHNCFDTPRDQVVWDVGHQGYPHKVLTGRAGRMNTLRQEDGLSGFLKRTESEYDTFGAGHAAATSISAAYGMAVGRDLTGEDFKVVAVIGDGSLGSGLAYEGLNNAGASGRDFVVVLNDNEMSIAPNVGAMHKYLASVQRNPIYNRIRSAVGDAASHAPGMLHASTLLKKWEESDQGDFSRPACCSRNLASATSVPGPIDGHDIKTLNDTFKAVRDMKGPASRPRDHAEGGKDSPPASTSRSGTRASARARSGDGQATEDVDGKRELHGGVPEKGLSELMTERKDIVALHRGDARAEETGTSVVAKAHPTRFFDVGIAEGGMQSQWPAGLCDACHTDPDCRDLFDVPPAGRMTASSSTTSRSSGCR